MSKAAFNRPIPCPRCRKPAAWKGNPHRPFCSETCRMIDLGCWADGEYRIPGEPAAVPEGGKVVPFRGDGEEREEF